MDLSSKKVMVAEDDSVTQEMMKDIFATMNLPVEIANNGEEAVEKFKANSYDLIFLDVRMPKKDGIQAVREMRGLEKGGKRVPIVALTASSSPDELSLIKASGFDELIEKPIDIAKLKGFIQQKLQG